MQNNSNILAKDVQFIKESLDNFAVYDLAADIDARMQALKLSQNKLAKRVKVSHTIVGHWLKREARPHGKERLKLVGLALEMDTEELNQFLRKNGYPGLYTKNPLDAACCYVISESADSKLNAENYLDFLELCELDAYVLNPEPDDISTTVLNREFNDVDSYKQFMAWFNKNEKYFRAYDKTYIATPQLVRFILLYIGNSSINELYITNELPVTIKNLLYPVLADKEITVRSLRAKLVVFGLYQNMAEAEIDILLNLARVQPLTEPQAMMDCIILLGLRCAHERYPYFELNNAKKVLANLSEYDTPELREFYEAQHQRANAAAKEYTKNGYKSDDKVFMEIYTDYAASGILQYMEDLFVQLVDDKVIPAAFAEEYTALMRTY